MSTSIYAYTEPGCASPAFVNLFEREPDVFVLTVRSQNSDGVAIGTIDLPRTKLLSLINEAGAYLDDEAKASGVVHSSAHMALTPCRDYEAEQRRAHALELALRSPGMLTYGDVLEAAKDYQAHLEGKTTTATDPDKPQPIGDRERALEELLRSACAIADRKGENTAWERFAASIHELGLSGITARTYRVLASDIE